jgi:C1A family cysteine protease
MPSFVSSVRETTLAKLTITLMLVSCGFVVADETATKPRELPKSVDLRPDFEKYGFNQRAQGKRGTCSVFATLEAVEFEIARHRGKIEPLSVEFSNWAANEVTSRKDDGDFFHNIIRGIEKHGLCTESALPYQKTFDRELTPAEEVKNSAKSYTEKWKIQFHWLKDWKKKPGLEDADLQKIKETLAAGHPVSAGSYHSILFVGYEDNEAHPGGGRLFIADSNRREREISYTKAKERFCDLFWVSVESANAKSAVGESTK